MIPSALSARPAEEASEASFVDSAAAATTLESARGTESAVEPETLDSTRERLHRLLRLKRLRPLRLSMRRERTLHSLFDVLIFPWHSLTCGLFLKDGNTT